MSATAEPRVRFGDHLIGAALCAAYVAVLLHTAPQLGLSRDEGTYVVAAQSYAEFIDLLLREPARALRAGTIDHFYGVNHEHPPLWKTLFALSYLADQKFGLFSRESLAFRFPGMVSAGLLLWLIHVFGTRIRCRRTGLFAALAFALLPRPFYHAHLDAFDLPIALMVTAVSYAYWRSLSDRRWALACGVLFGLALLTKHNSWMLPGIFAIHFAVVVLGQARLRARGAAVELSQVPYWLISMLLLGPAIFFGGWPWLWHDTLTRVRDYAAFHLQHEYYNMAYFGVNYFWPPFPLSYPWVMTLYTVPVTTLLLAFAGIGVAARAEIASVRDDLGRAGGAASSDPTQTVVLLLGCLLAPLVAFLLPHAPIFGGTKHWFTAYPFLALFAALGFEAMLFALRALSPQRIAGWGARMPWFVGALLLLPAFVETAHSHPFGLSHYGFAAGFVPGAADRGMNRQFWGFTTGSLVDFFYEHLPRGGSVYVCDTTDTAFRMLARDGLLPANIVPSFDIAEADYALVHHEHHFTDVEVQIWSSYGTTRPIYVLSYDGVPIVSVYKNPRR
jgi:4-amino-4-deoxy-L-arabinose transferase-like glycosyltransferase